MPTRRIPSLNWLRVFEAAARNQSFTRAAEQLGMSSAAVSQQVKALETHFKKPLFNRGPHSIELTAAGRAFLPVVQQALSTLEVSAAGLFGNRRREPLSILATLMFANGWLANHLADFQQQHPHIHLQISTYNDYHLTQYSRDYELRILFASGPQYAEEGDLLSSETLYPVALPHISQQINMLHDLLNFRLINVNEHHTGWIEIFQHESELFLTEAEFLFTDNSTTALTMAAAGLGIALARMPASDGFYQQLGLARCLEGFSASGSQNYYLTYPSLSGLSKAARRFRLWLLDSFGVQE